MPLRYFVSPPISFGWERLAKMIKMIAMGTPPAKEKRYTKNNDKD